MKKSKAAAAGLLLAAALPLTALAGAAPGLWTVPEEVYLPGTSPLQRVHSGGAPFRDLEDHWAARDIQWGYQYGLLQGNTKTAFDPDMEINRAMFVTMLGRLEGIDPAQYADRPFADVEADSWYAPYVTWAWSRGLIQGRDDAHFDPFSSITREETAVLLQRLPGTQGNYYSQAQPFTDQTQASVWASDSLTAVRSSGLMRGYPEGDFAPHRPLTRAEAAALLHRLAQRRFQEV